MGDLRIRREGHAGRVTLTRPRALNALSHAMCRDILDALDAWARDPAIALVLVDGIGDRAFCAGGDVAAMYRAAVSGDLAGARAFFRDEYRMNVRIAEYPRPVVSLLHGFVLGGGVGVGAQGSHRIVGESAQVAMPECAIGLVPDVGGTYRLRHAPGRLGDYLGLSGARMGPGDAILAGFADTFVPQAAWSALIADLVAQGDVGAIARHARAAPPAPLSGLAPAIDRLFAGPDVDTILSALQREPGDFAARTHDALAAASPLSLAMTLALLRGEAAAVSVRAAIRSEYRAIWRLVVQGDALEGIRARLIDKDGAPRWRHAGAGAVDAQEVAAMLAPLGDDELDLEDA